MTHVQRARRFLQSWGALREAMVRDMPEADRENVVADLADEFDRVARQAVEPVQSHDKETP